VAKTLGNIYLLSGDGTTGEWRRYNGPTSPYALRSLLERECRTYAWAKLYEAHPVATPSGDPAPEAVLFQVDSDGTCIGSRSVSVATLEEADRNTVSLRVCRQRVGITELGQSGREWRTRIRCYSGESRYDIVDRAVKKIFSTNAEWAAENGCLRYGQVTVPVKHDPNTRNCITASCRVLFE
jgi:hypothetical protein